MLGISDLPVLRAGACAGPGGSDGKDQRDRNAAGVASAFGFGRGNPNHRCCGLLFQCRRQGYRGRSRLRNHAEREPKKPYSATGRPFSRSCIRSGGCPKRIKLSMGDTTGLRFGAAGRWRSRTFQSVPPAGRTSRASAGCGLSATIPTGESKPKNRRAAVSLQP